MFRLFAWLIHHKMNTETQSVCSGGRFVLALKEELMQTENSSQNGTEVKVNSLFRCWTMQQFPPSPREVKWSVTGGWCAVNAKRDHREAPVAAALGISLAPLSRNCRLMGSPGQSKVLVMGLTTVPAGSGFTSYCFISFKIKTKEEYLRRNAWNMMSSRKSSYLCGSQEGSNR